MTPFAVSSKMPLGRHRRSWTLFSLRKKNMLCACKPSMIFCRQPFQADNSKKRRGANGPSEDRVYLPSNSAVSYTRRWQGR
jgi:hypothetical protein